MTERAVILTSGGLDSTTVLAIAHARERECYTLSFDYGQCHRAELDAAKVVSANFPGTTHKIIEIDLREIAGSALTDDAISVPTEPVKGIPVTYVPARNTVFLSVALSWAETLDASEIYLGVNAVDYSGYPDCCPAFIDAFQQLANVATKVSTEGRTIKICTPIIDMTKADIILAGTKLGVDYSLTVSCYQADDDGVACGVCDSCRHRRKGFIVAGIPDPTRYIE